MAASFNSPAINLGSFTLTGSSSAQYYEMCIVKYSLDGSVIWAKTSDGNYSNHRTGEVKTDDKGNVYLTGTYSSPIIFGTDTLKISTEVNYLAVRSERQPDSPHSKIFIVKYDSIGNVLFAKGIGSEGDDKNASLSPDHFGNVYLCGQFNSDSISIGSKLLINSQIAHSNGTDMFVAKMDLGTTPSVFTDNENNHNKIYPNSDNDQVITKKGQNK
jgi:hypothetical protein